MASWAVLQSGREQWNGGEAIEGDERRWSLIGTPAGCTVSAHMRRLARTRAASDVRRQGWESHR